MGETRLFIDWINIDKGGIHGTFDSERISDEGWRIIERNKKTWGLHADLSGHGMKSRRVPHGVRITIEKARKSGPWLQQDRPWEKKIYFITVIHEDGKYRGWYGVEFPRHREAGNDTEQVLDKDQKAGFNRTGLCYAESEDGMHWIKPELGLIEFEGMKNNNIVSTSDLVSSAVFRDDSAPPEERYKAFAWDRLSDVPYRADYGLFGAFSPDGYHWTRTSEPLLPYFHDTQNIACWDAERQKYVGYFRHHLGGRAISYAETDDFRNWPETEVIAHAGPLDDPDVDYYTNCYVRYPGLPSVKLLFPAMYHHSSDQLDVRLAVTHNGKAIKWVSHDPIIEVGEPGAWDGGRVYAGPEMVRLPDGTLAMPYLGVNATHNESAFMQFYEDGHDLRSGHGWAIWDEGRIAGIEARNRGEFWTQPTSCSGQPIEINARTTRSGSVEVELWDCEAGGNPIAGFTLEECIAFRGDAIWTPLRWKGKVDLSELKGRTIQLRIRLSSAKIFGYRLVSDSGAVSS
jgi:hypothetical protein